MMMMLTPELLGDFAVLSSLSVLVHYFFGVYGIAAAVALATLLEHGADLLSTVLEKVAGYDYLKSAIAKKAASTVDTIRRRRPTKTRNGSAAARLDDGDDDGDGSDRLYRDSDASDQQEDDEDPRVLLEHFSTATSATAEDVFDHQHQRDSSVISRGELASEEDRESILDEISRLVIRDVGSTATTEIPVTPDEKQQPQQSTLPDDLDAAVDAKNPSDNIMHMNSRTPIAFENDLFKGKAYFLVRTSPEDPHWSRLFLGRRRMFWIQVQGKFKRAPKGTVYLGGELPSPISPGIFTKSIALVIMGIIQQLVGNVNFSFGDVDSEVVPSIALPLYQSADQLIVTPAGDEPPPLGERDFGESDEARKARRQTPVGSEKYVVGDTYSFDFHTMYVDLTRWKTANLPGLSEMELSTFFDSLPMRMVAYDIQASPLDRHLQRQKDYLFSFEVEYDRGHERRRRRRRQSRQQGQLRRTESGNSEETVSVNGVLSTDGSGGTSTAVSEASSFDEQTLVLDETMFLNQENAQRLRELSFSYLCWLEEVDVATGVRRVHYVFSVKRKEDGGSHQLAVVSAYALRVLLVGHKGKKRQIKRDEGLHSLRFHSQSRIGSYSTISDEAFVITQRLEKLVEQSYAVDDERDESPASLDDNELHHRDSSFDLDDDLSFQSALYQCFSQRSQLQAPQSTNATCSPSKLGVNLSKRDREDLRVVFEGVVYRYYSESFLRQEVLFVTPEELLFYRSYSSSSEKNVPCSRVIGVQSVKMPRADGIDEKCAFVFQINTFAEEIVLCVGTEHARNSWIRVLLQHCHPHANFDHSLHDAQMHICYAASKPLKPASRIILNARALFPRQMGNTTTADALKIVEETLKRALRIHKAERLSVVDILEFLNAASALRTIDLQAVQREFSHEQKMAFYLNLYHAVLAHAMISHGFPRGKSQWEFFLTHMCYSVGMQEGTHKHQVSLSLAEIEHVVLRNRMPRAELPHLRLHFLQELHASRLSDLGISHPDFRLVFALVMNQEERQEIVIYESEKVHDQLNALAKKVLRNCVDVHATDKATVYLPRICEWYRLDFGGGGSPLYCVRKLLGFLEEHVQQEVVHALEDPLATRIKFRAFKYTPKTVLVNEQDAA